MHVCMHFVSVRIATYPPGRGPGAKESPRKRARSDPDPDARCYSSNREPPEHFGGVGGVGGVDVVDVVDVIDVVCIRFMEETLDDFLPL